MATTEPQKWAATLGNTADVNALPATTPSGSGRASTSGLFPPVTQLPLDQGGIAPERGDFNALFKYLGEYLFYLMQGGTFSYSTDYDYTAGNLVMHGGSLYLCIASNGPGSAIKYPTDTAYWRQLALTSQLPVVNNGTLTIQKDGVTVATFTANQAGNATANLVISEIHSQGKEEVEGGRGSAGWVRFKSGLQIVFKSGVANTIVNFPVAFIAQPRLVMTSVDPGIVTSWYGRTATSFKGLTFDSINHQWVDKPFDFIAIGFWK